MKKGTKNTFLLFIGIFLLLLFALSYFGAINLDIIKSSFFAPAGAIIGLEKAVFCNGFEWLSCGEKSTTNLQASLSTTPSQIDSVFTCNYKKCEFSGWGSSLNFEQCFDVILRKNGTPVYTISGLANLFDEQVNTAFRTYSQPILNGMVKGNTFSYTCTTFPFISNGTSVAKFYYTGKTDQLVWCGSSACPASLSGVPVLGADGCKFNLGDLTVNGSPLDVIFGAPNKDGTTINNVSYTIPINSSLNFPSTTNRYICGYIGETCSINTDCSGHTYDFPYGSGLRNAEASAGQLVVYGCTTLSSQDCVEWSGDKPNTGKCLKYDNAKRCGPIQSRTIQCIPGTSSCGSNAFCDPTDYICKPTYTGCKSDNECGVSQLCDRENKILKQAVCNISGTMGTCGFKTLQNVDGCSDVDCPVGYFLNAQYKCEKSIEGMLECADVGRECCENLVVNGKKVRDKPAPEGKQCCDGTVKTVCDSQQDCKVDADCLDKEKVCANGKCVAKDDKPCPNGYTLVNTKTQSLTDAIINGFAGVFGAKLDLGTTNTYCQKDIDYTLIWLAVIAIIALIVLALIFKKGPAKPIIKYVRRRK